VVAPFGGRVFHQWPPEAAETGNHRLYLQSGNHLAVDSWQGDKWDAPRLSECEQNPHPAPPRLCRIYSMPGYKNGGSALCLESRMRPSTPEHLGKTEPRSDLQITAKGPYDGNRCRLFVVKLIEMSIRGRAEQLCREAAELDGGYQMLVWGELIRGQILKSNRAVPEP